MKNILKVRMLGGFTLEYKGKELVLNLSPPRKLSETLSKKYEKMFKKQNHEIVEEITPMI